MHLQILICLIILQCSSGQHVLDKSDFKFLEFPTPKQFSSLLMQNLEADIKNLGKNLQEFVVDGDGFKNTEIGYAIEKSSDNLGSILGTIDKIPEFIKNREFFEGLVVLKGNEQISILTLQTIVAQISPINTRIHEMLNKNTNIEIKRHSVIPALYACEVLANLFKDVELIKYKIIFAPYLMAFSGLYSTVAKLSSVILPYKSERLRYDMSNLTEIIKSYRIESTEMRVDLIRQRNLPLEQIKLICPKSVEAFQDRSVEAFLQYWDQKSDPEHFTRSKTGCVLGEEGYEFPDLQNFENLDEDSVHVYQDLASRTMYCGWENCYENLQLIIEEQMDNFFETGLKLIPHIQVKEKPKLCSGTYTNFRHREGFGCHKGYCWSYCSLLGLGISHNWCYTKTNSNYVKCESDSDCCPEWKCKGPCAAF